MWRLTSFVVGETTYTLPTANAVHDIGGAESMVSLITLSDGQVWDPLGSADAPPRFPREIAFSGEIVEAVVATARTAYDTLLGMRGRLGTLWRINDAGDEQWCTARCTAVRATRDRRNVLYLPVEIVFSAQTLWQGETITTETSTLMGQVEPQSVVVGNDGNATQRDVEVTITVLGGSLSWISLRRPAISGIRYDGTMDTGDVLVFDCGAKTVTFNGADAYSGFSFTADQAQDDWLPLPPGDTTVIVQFGYDGVTTFQLDFEFYALSN